MSSYQRPKVLRHRAPCDPPSKESTNSFWHSEPSALLTAHRSTRELPKTADVVIIGSGMTGASVAHHLLDDSRGQSESGERPSVVMLEAREACWGATGRNGGHCQPVLFENPHDSSIGNFELNNFNTLSNLIQDRGIDCEFVPQSAVRAIYDSRHLADVEIALSIIQQTSPHLAQRMTLVTGKNVLEALRIPTAVGAIMTDTAARMWPYKFVSRILEDLLTADHLKGTFNLQTLTPVEGIKSSSDNDRWIVKTPRGSISASKVVLATNAYTSHLLPDFSDLIVPVRGQMSALTPLDSVARDKRLKRSYGFMGDGIDDYLIQRPDIRGGHLMFGGGRQHDGHSVGTTDDTVLPDSVAKYLRTKLVDALDLPEGMTNTMPSELMGHRRRTERVKQALMSLDRSSNPTEFSATHEWTGIMGFSRDDHPWVGPVTDKPNLYIAAGYTGHGMPNTWLCGRTVAIMVEKTLNSPANTAEAIAEATKHTGLPESYLVSKERILRAMELDDVEAKDWAEMERGRRREMGDRPHSGYA